MSFEHVVIAGAGHAGGCAAGALRAAVFAGRITMIGIEAHPPYERPPLSKELLAGYVPVEKAYLQPLDWYTQAGIDLQLGTEVLGIERSRQKVYLSKGPRLHYDALLLTTGARARTVPHLTQSDPRVFYVRDINDSLALRTWLRPNARVGVIGVGFIGLEIAATARKAGCTVVVLELADRPLSRAVPAEVGTYVAELHRRSGVELQLKSSVRAIGTDSTGRTLQTADGRRIEVDVVVIGIGAVPNTEVAAASGLAVDDGVVVNQFGRTSDEHIFAAGDVTKHFNPILGRAVRLEAWQNAQNQAIAVAKVIAGGSDPFAEVPWLWTDQYDMNMRSPARRPSGIALCIAGIPLPRALPSFRCCRMRWSARSA